MIRWDYFGCESAGSDGTLLYAPAGEGTGAWSWQMARRPIAVIATSFETEIIVLCGRTVVARAA